MTKKPAYTNNHYQPKEVDRDSQEYKNKREVYIWRIEGKDKFRNQSDQPRMMTK